MSSFLFPLQHQGSVDQIESFASYFCRLTALHCVTSGVLYRALRDWYSDKHPNEWSPVVNSVHSSKGAGLFGQSRTTDFIVRAVEESNGSRGLRRGTLLPLLPVISDRKSLTLRAHRAWCPYCFRDDEADCRPAYDRLIWQLPFFNRCHIHKVKLQRNCSSCGQLQVKFDSSANLLSCFKCNELLSSPTAEMDPTPSFGETECLSLVASLATGELDNLSGNPVSAFQNELNRTLSPIASTVQSISAPSGIKRAMTPTPTLKTFIKKAYACGLPPEFILLTPIEAAHAAGQLVYDTKKIPLEARPRHSDTIRNEIAETMRQQMMLPEASSMLSLRAIAVSQGVTQGFIRYALKDLVPSYQEKRERAIRLAALFARTTARKTLDQMLYEHGEALLLTEQKSLAKLLASRAGCSVAMARTAIARMRTPVEQKLADQTTFGEMIGAYYENNRTNHNMCDRSNQIAWAATLIWDTPAFDVTQDDLVEVCALVEAGYSPKIAYKLVVHISFAYSMALKRTLSHTLAHRLRRNAATNPAVVLQPWIAARRRPKRKAKGSTKD